MGADSFTLTVRGRGLNWTTQLDEEAVCSEQTCEFTYPREIPLQPGTSYRLVIEANNGRSSAEETTAGLGFKLLEPTEAAEVDQSVRLIQEQNLSAISKALALTSVYTSYNLIAEAILTLESVPQAEKTAEVHRQLGDLYRQIGLPLEAEVQYREAIAKAANNPFELAAAQFGLGEVSYLLGRRDDAVRFLQAAKTEYERLGDVARANELEQRLAQVRL